MWELDTNTTAVPVLDRFEGDKALVHLSEKLMEWDEAPVKDSEIANALGDGMVDAFRYTQRKLAGRVRKVTGEPSLCHSADVSIRAATLGYGPDVIKACLLHDVAEDTSSSYDQLPDALDEIAEIFSTTLARDVTLLTNRYQLLFQAAARKVNAKIEPSQRGLDAFRAALDVVRFESSRELVDFYAREFASLSSFLQSNIDLSEATTACSRNRKFTFAKFLERQIYGLYIHDIAHDSAHRVHRSRGKVPVPLVVKSVDIIDNVRTSEVSNRSTLDKLARKAETIIDLIEISFLCEVPQELAITSTVSILHRIVQIRLVDQIKLRRRAVAENFSETRFASLVRFLAKEGTRLEAKYRVPKNRVEVTEKLENEVRRINEGLSLGGQVHPS